MEVIKLKSNTINIDSEPIPSGETLNALKLQYDLPPETTWEEIKVIMNDPANKINIIKQGDKLNKEI